MGLQSPEWIDFVEKHSLPLRAKEAWALYCVHEVTITTPIGRTLLQARRLVHGEIRSHHGGTHKVDIRELRCRTRLAGRGAAVLQAVIKLIGLSNNINIYVAHAKP
jgi:hypothetical protein